jgi:hypothetical protein
LDACANKAVSKVATQNTATVKLKTTRLENESELVCVTKVIRCFMKVSHKDREK